MRLKEDATRWRVSALLKRDFKHDHSEEYPVKDICEMVGISRATLYKYLADRNKRAANMRF
jgi:hypothetical protein